MNETQWSFYEASQYPDTPTGSIFRPVKGNFKKSIQGILPPETVQPSNVYQTEC